MEGTSLDMGTIFTFSLNGRSFFLFEGTGVPGGTFQLEVLIPANAYSGHGTVLSTITIGDDGKFSVLLPDDYARAGNILTFGYAGDAFAGLVAAENRNTVLETVTKLPDWIRCRQSLRNLFMGCTSLRRIDADLSWTSTVTNMGQLFASCTSLEEMPNLNTSNATNTMYMFGDCYQLTEGIPLDLAKSTDAHGMYFNCRNLESVPNINTVKNLNFYYMFKNCYKLTHIEGIETGAATRFTSMFEDCRTLETIPYMDTSKGTNFDAMFKNCYKLKNYETLDTRNGTSFSQTFYNCDAFETKDDIKVTDVSKGTVFDNMLAYCNNLQSFRDDWDFSSAVSVEGFLRDCPKLKSFPSYSFPSVTRMADMFAGDVTLQTVGAMDTPKVNRMQRIFFGCYKLEASPLRNTATCQNMNRIFYSAGTQVPDGLIWYPIDMSNVTTAEGFIFGCNVKEIPYLNTEKVQTPHYNTSGKNHIFSSSLVTIGGMNMSAVTVDDLWLSSNNLTNLGPLDGLKMNLTLNCPNLTHDSAVTVINSLGEVSGKTLKFHTNVYSTLTADEIAIATAKGWTISAY